MVKRTSAATHGLLGRREVPTNPLGCRSVGRSSCFFLKLKMTPSDRNAASKMSSILEISILRLDSQTTSEKKVCTYTERRSTNHCFRPRRNLEPCLGLQKCTLVMPGRCTFLTGFDVSRRLMTRSKVDGSACFISSEGKVT